MIGYLDTSALIPLLVSEPGSELSQTFFESADDLISLHLIQVEASAAIGMARRHGRIDDAEYQGCTARLGDLLGMINLIEVSPRVIERASQLAPLLALRGYDAMHCAAAELAAGEELVAAAGDKALLRGWNALGIDTLDILG